jgi:hypothetical protein
LENLGVDVRIILKWISKNGMGVWTGFIWLRTGPSGKLLDLQVPQDEGNFLTSWRPVSFSRITLLCGVTEGS